MLVGDLPFVAVKVTWALNPNLSPCLLLQTTFPSGFLLSQMSYTLSLPPLQTDVSFFI